MKNKTIPNMQHKQLKYKNQSIKLFLLFLLVQIMPCLVFSANQDHDTIRNICEYLGGRSDKNFLGSGNVALVIEPGKTKVLLFSNGKTKVCLIGLQVPFVHGVLTG